MKGKLSKPMIRAIVTLGTIVAEQQWLLLNLDMLSRHMFLAGGTGNGKTMLLLLIMRQLIDIERLTGQRVGFTFVTPHPDGREKLLHWCHLHNIDPDRIEDMTPSPDCCVGIDPFAHPPKDASPMQYEAWLRATVGRVVSAILRNVPKAEQEVMNRLKRWLKNVLYACGKDVDGKHLGIDKALILLDPEHPEFEPIMDRLWDHLPDEIRADFRNLRETKNARQREQWVESTINRLRELLESPFVREMLSQEHRAVNDEAIIHDGKIQIVSVPETDYQSRDQGNVIAGLRISAMMAAAKRIAERVPEDQRVYHFLILDEAENFVGEDLRTGFQELRKFKMPIIFVVQDISCCIKGDLDILSKVASQCGVQATANQQDPDSLDYLAKAFAYPFLNHTPLYATQVLPVGYELIQTQSVSFNTSEGVSASQARSMTETRSVTKQQHAGQSVQESVSLALSNSHSEGGSAGESDGWTWAKGTSSSRQVTDSQSHANSRQRSRSNSYGETEGTTESESTGLSHQESSSHGSSRSRQNNWSESNGSSQHDSTGSTEGSSESEGRSRVVGGAHDTVSRNAGRNSGKNESHGSSSSSSQSSGGSEGASETQGQSTSTGMTQTTGRGTSRGTSRTSGQTEGEGETDTAGRAVSEGRTESDNVGGSKTVSKQANWSDAMGTTASRGTGTGRSWGSSTGESNGRSNGQTDSRSASRTDGMAVSFNQVPLPLHQFIDVPTGKLVVSVPDQISMFLQCIASLRDRVLLVKVRGMNRPFLLEVHHVQDPYEQLKLVRCRQWREIELKKYVAKIRAANPFYFRPGEDGEEGDAQLIPFNRPKPPKPVPAMAEASPML